MKKILVVFGTRPEAIKMARLVQLLKQNPQSFEVLVCVTAQHREMLDQVLEVFEIHPDIDLNLMSPGQDLSSVSSAVLRAMRLVLEQCNPDIVLVHGDTTTAFAAALAAFYQGIPVGHVEAGLRTHNLESPFPEEFNRQVVSRIAKWHFAPTQEAKENLLAEGTDESSVLVTGNTVIDSLLWMNDRMRNDEDYLRELETDFFKTTGISVPALRYVLVTVHRRESFGHGIREICVALKDLAAHYPEWAFIYPVHLNPNVQKPVREILGGVMNIHLIPPQDYKHFVYLLRNCYFVITDSGGIQEEAPSLGKPVIVTRDTTERPEAINSGSIFLAGTSRSLIVSKSIELFDSDSVYSRMSSAKNPFGDGNSAQRIIEFLLKL